MTDPNDTTRRLTGSALDNIDVPGASGDEPDDGTKRVHSAAVALIEYWLGLAREGNYQGAIVIVTNVAAASCGYHMLGQLNALPLITALTDLEHWFFEQGYIDEDHIEISFDPAQFDPTIEVPPEVEPQLVRALEDLLEHVQRGEFQGVVIFPVRSKTIEHLHDHGGMFLPTVLIGNVVLAKMHMGSMALVQLQQQQQRGGGLIQRPY